MNTQEKQVIDEIFGRLKNVSDQPRDVEVEAYIANLIKQQPYAPYALAQFVYVQEQALLNAHQEIEALKAENGRLAAQPQQGGGFLSGLFGGGQAQQVRGAVPSYGQRQSSAPAYGQQGMQPSSSPGPWAQQAAQPHGGMGFLGTAAAAAAGVAGGVVLGHMLSSAFGGGQAHAATGTTNLFDGTAPQREPVADTQTYGPAEDYGPHASDFDRGDFGGGDNGGDY